MPGKCPLNLFSIGVLWDTPLISGKRFICVPLHQSNTLKSSADSSVRIIYYLPHHDIYSGFRGLLLLLAFRISFSWSLESDPLLAADGRQLDFAQENNELNSVIDARMRVIGFFSEVTLSKSNQNTILECLSVYG